MIPTALAAALACVLCAGTLAPSAGGRAQGPYAPKLVVQQGSRAITLDVTMPPAGDPTASLTFFAPAGADATLSASEGATIGTVDAYGTAAGATFPLTGTVQARGAGDEATLRCASAETHAASWLAALRAGDRSLELPIFVDAVASPPLARIVSYSLTICLPPPDGREQAGDAASGTRLSELRLTLPGVFSAPSSGDNLWRLLATPYSAETGTPDVAASVETQSFVETATITLGPLVRTLTRTAVAVRASGTVAVTGLSDTAAGIVVARGASPAQLVAVARPSAPPQGTFSYRFSLRRLARARTLYLQAAAVAPQRDLAATACKATFDVPCVGATAGGFTAKSTTRSIAVPALRS